MDMNGKNIGIVVLVIIILLGGWFLLTRTPGASTPTTATSTPETTTTTTTSTTTTTTGTTSVRPQDVTVTLTDTGFSPQTVTVRPGTTVIFVNKSAGVMNVASAPHPTHQAYDGTTESVHCAATYTGPAPFDECGSGTSFSFTFGKEGSWKYHNHVQASQFGTIIVSSGAAASTTGSVNVTL